MDEPGFGHHDGETRRLRRMPRGGTTHPPLRRPGNGYGRPLRPGPCDPVVPPQRLVAEGRYDAVELLLLAAAAERLGEPAARPSPPRAPEVRPGS